MAGAPRLAASCETWGTDCQEINSQEWQRHLRQCGQHLYMGSKLSVLTTFNNNDPMTYDAFGRMVEVHGKPILYSLLGKIGRLNTGGS